MRINFDKVAPVVITVALAAGVRYFWKLPEKVEAGGDLRDREIELDENIQNFRLFVLYCRTFGVRI